MRKGQSRDIKELLVTNTNASLDDVISIVGDNGNSLANALFLLVNEILDEYPEQSDLSFLDKAFNFILIVLQSDKEINRKRIPRKVARLEEKINRIKTEKAKHYNKTKMYQDLGKVSEHLENIEEINETSENKTYSFLKYLIGEVKNLSYLTQTFKQLESSVNLIDKNGDALITNVIKKYLSLIDNPTENKEDILYYNNVISLIEHNKNFYNKEEEKRKVLQLIYNKIDALDKKDHFIKEKLYWLTNVKEIVQEDKDKFDIDKLSAKYNITIDFNERLIDELGMYQTSISNENYPNRIISNEYIISIDDQGSYEIDDALSAKRLKNGNYLLGVHIASVLGYFPYYSNIVQTALERTTSIYLPKRYASNQKQGIYSKIIPMLPPEFSAQSGSLLENVPRLTNSYYFELDKEGNVVNQKYLKTITTNNKKATYSEVNNIIKNGTDDKRLDDTVQTLNEICYILEEKKKKNELYMALKLDKTSASNTAVGNSRSEKIVNETMLLTGSKVADYFAHSKEGYPCLYRTLEFDEQFNKEFDQIKNKLVGEYDIDRFNKLYEILKGIYPTAKYGMSGSHEGLNLKHYTHCTSPLRRGADIILENALDVCYFNDPKDKDIVRLEEEIKRRMIEINNRKTSIDWFLMDYKRSYPKQKRR